MLQVEWPSHLTGVTLLAFGNGGPDVFSSLAAVKQGNFDLAIAGLLGGGAFITTVVVGAVTWPTKVEVDKAPFSRDTIGYILVSLQA